MLGYMECIHCGNQRDITHNTPALRTVPVSTTPTNIDRWINFPASPQKSPGHTTPRDRSLEVNVLIDRYVMDQHILTSLGSLWDSFLKAANISPKRNRRTACIAVLILSNPRMWKGHDEIQNIRSEIRTRDLYRAFKYIKGLESVDLLQYIPDLESFKLEELDWSSHFTSELWDRALVFDQHLLRLNLRAYSQKKQGNGVKWVRYSNTVVRAMAVLMAFAEVKWNPGMAAGGKWIKDMTALVLTISGLSTSATRTVRSPLNRLFPYIPILGDETQVEELLDFYHVVVMDVMGVMGAEVMVMGVGGGEEVVETFDLSQIRTSFVCGKTELFADLAVDNFDDFMRDFARGDGVDGVDGMDGVDGVWETQDTSHTTLPLKWNLRQKLSGKFLLTVSGRLSNVRELMDHFDRLSGGLYPPKCYRICNQMTTMSMFEDKSFVIADQDRTREVCVEAGFEFLGTVSTKIMLGYGEYNLTVFETGLIMIFGVLEKHEMNADHLSGLQTAIAKFTKQIEKTSIDSGRMMGALIEFGESRDTWDTRTEYFKKKERNDL